MDLRAYYKKVREAEASLTSDHVVLVSMATPEGGRPGVLTEAPRNLAAKMIAEGRSREATPEETSQFRADLTEAKKAYEDAEAARRMQVVVVPSNQLKRERS